MSSGVRGLLALLLLAAGTLAAPAAAGVERDRVLAIGDIHGSLEGLTAILRETGLLDADGNWSGGTARLVQTGDFTDRGAGVRPAMDLLMKLQEQAPESGGEVVVLLGNHELLNLMRHESDVVVNPAIYASFIDAESEIRRQAALLDWKRWRGQRDKIPGIEAPAAEESVEEWLERHPPGFVEYHRAFSADGYYGRWLRTLPIVHRIGETIFLHGGISPTFARLSLERINEIHAEEIRALDQAVAKLERLAVIPPNTHWVEMRAELDGRVANPEVKRQRRLISDLQERLGRFVAITGSAESPLWFRGWAPPPYGLGDTDLAALRDQLTEIYGARYFVSAHTPFHGSEIAVRLDSFFLIDTGMLKAVYDGRPSALEMTGEGIAAVYPGERKVLLATEPRHDDRVGRSVGRRYDLARVGSRFPAPRAVFASAQPEAARELAPLAPDDFPPRLWLGNQGDRLPFTEPDEAERYLRSANVLSKTPIGIGKSGALRLELELDGVRARAVYHTIDDHRSPGSSGGPIRLSHGTTMLRFRDSYSGQVAAYHLARMMGLDNVPPAVIREVDGVEGSVALWIENGTNLTSWNQTHERQPQNGYYQQQLYDMRVFDALVNNKDRNTGNIFWTPDWNLWLIDHTRAFAQDSNLYRPDLVQRCSRDLLSRIQELDEDAALERLKPYLSIFEVKAIFKRRKRLLRYLNDRIQKLGEERVLFDYGDPLGLVTVKDGGGDAA